MNTTSKAIMAVAIVAVLAVAAVGAGFAYTAQTSNSANVVGEKFMILDQGNDATAFTDAYVNKVVWNTEQYVDTTDSNKVKVRGSVNSTVDKAQDAVYSKITVASATGAIAANTELFYLGTDDISLTNKIDGTVAKIPAHVFEITAIENLANVTGFTYYIDITAASGTPSTTPTANTLKLAWNATDSKWESTETDKKIDAALAATGTAAAETVHVSLYLEAIADMAFGEAGTYTAPQPDENGGIGLTYLATISDDKAHAA